MSRRMRTLFALGRYPHRFGVYYADRFWFAKPGVTVWCFGRHWRVLPLPRRRRG